MLAAPELKKRAEPFGPSDLVRLFHSLAETEARLKDATQPRYMLEIGLVKLIEMRRLASVESILDRLADLETSFDKAPMAKAAAVPDLKPAHSTPAEKKTLKTDLPIESSESLSFEAKESADVSLETAASPVIDLDFIKALPVRLPPIPSEELEHVEDQWLDDAYDRKLTFSGDDLTPISDVRSLVAGLINETSNLPTQVTVSASTSSTSAAVAMALSETVEPSSLAEIELPELGEEPTEQQLAAYANAHTAVRAALKVFRGKIIGVKKRPRPR
jgi:DNA polymerase III gamma/tau subunit